MKTSAEEIEKAKRALLDSNIVDRKSNSYPSPFNGYISSFGASLVQAGLLPTIIFFERQDHGAEEKRDLIIKALKIMMDINENGNMATYILGKENNATLRRCDDPAFVDKVVRNMTAMKLALRMFNKKSNNDNGQKQ